MVDNGDTAAEEPLKEDIQLEKLGHFNDDLIFKFRKGEHIKVFTYFKNFYVHRMGFVGQQKK